MTKIKQGDEILIRHEQKAPGIYAWSGKYEVQKVILDHVFYYDHDGKVRQRHIDECWRVEE